MSFEAFGLSRELLQSITELGYTTPSDIQSDAIPAVLSRRDVIAIANTGTGKTASFALPILQLLLNSSNSEQPLIIQPKSIRALIITPTRELAAQVTQSIQAYGRHTNIHITGVFGGVRIEPQIFALQQGIDLLVATPGRLLDLYDQQALNFDQIDILVLDEADRMLDLGFVDAISRVQALLPKVRQTLLFSATFSKDIKSLAKNMLNDPMQLELATANNNIEAIEQRLHPVDKERKSELLLDLINTNDWQQLLVFVRTKRDADTLRDYLESKGMSAESIHANRTQRARTLALDGFKNGGIKILVATDIAARGIDIDQLPCVINFDLPYIPEDYVHRIGRTGRASASGLAISFFSEDESEQLKAVERVLGRQFKRFVLPRFAPVIKPPAPTSDDDEYGNFEADTQIKRKGKPRARKQRGRR